MFYFEPILTPLTIAFVILQIADVGLTYYALEKHTKFKELNPVMDKLMKKIGTLPALLLTKTAICGAVLFYPLSNTLLGLLIGLYLIIVGNNINQLR